MSEVVIARMQNRRGLRRDLPQPLDPGEFGFCLDTLQLYVGADPSDPNSVISPVIEGFVPDAQTNIYCNEIAQTQVVQVNLDDPNVPVPDGAYSSAIVVNSFTFDDLTGDLISGISWLGYASPLVNLPIVTEGTARFFGDPLAIAPEPTNMFGSAQLAMDPLYYTVIDSGAVAEVMNFIFVDPATMNRPGLVTVKQNVEIITEVTLGGIGTGGNLDSDVLLPGIRLPLGPATSWTPTGLSYIVTDSDSYKMDYSLHDLDNAPPEFQRTGTITIATFDGGVAPTNTSTMDNNTEIDNSGNDIMVEFRAVMLGSTVSIEYITSLQVPNLEFTTNTRRWLSFVV